MCFIFSGTPWARRDEAKSEKTQGVLSGKALITDYRPTHNNTSSVIIVKPLKRQEKK